MTRVVVMQNHCHYAHPLNKWFDTCIAIIFKYWVHTVYLIKRKVLYYTIYKEHCELYTKVHDLIAVNSCQIELFKKDKIVLRDNTLIEYSKLSASGNFKLSYYIQGTLQAATYSIDANAIAIIKQVKFIWF